ncbi:hypothetical protein EDD16DRAFT_1520445 [Pisolithus croceorrhizus]|nr:hypothetical protein EDD16DRAFT_1520445 [Pisolithus croceorrhizus]KAI6142564.1 hypothetical protein EDD17DRAFT_1515733 [Pisolithus thermaeus]
MLQGFTAFVGWFTPKSLRGLIALDFAKRSQGEYEVRLFRFLECVLGLVLRGQIFSKSGKVGITAESFSRLELGVLSRQTFGSNPRYLGSTELAEWDLSLYWHPWQWSVQQEEEQNAHENLQIPLMIHTTYWFNDSPRRRSSIKLHFLLYLSPAHARGYPNRPVAWGARLPSSSYDVLEACSLMEGRYCTIIESQDVPATAQTPQKGQSVYFKGPSS